MSVDGPHPNDPPMPTLPAYHVDPYRTELPVRVRPGVHDGRPVAWLADTVLYPGGGGQPADRGTLAGIAVRGIEREADGYRLTLSAPVNEGDATLALDWTRRFDHMQQHTAQHLLTAVASDRFGWDTTSFHLGETLCDVELDVASLSEEQMEELEVAVAEAIRAALPVETRWVTLEAYAELDVRSRGLPADHEGDVRLVEIRDLDRTTCGGIHLRSTAEIEALTLLGTEGMRGGTRLYWVAGGRVRRRLREWEDRGRALRAALGVGDDELVSAANARGEQLKDALKAARRLQDELSGLRARELATQDGPVASVHLEGWEAAAARAVAQAFTSIGGDRIGLVTADGGSGAFFAVAAGPECPFDVGGLGAGVAEALQGRGGGSGRLFQGKAPTLDGRDAALHLLRGAAKGDGS